MKHCPRCGNPIEPDASQCEICGEILTKRRPSSRTEATEAPASAAIGPAAEPPVADVLRSIFQPMRFSAPAVWWMITCGICGLISTGFAFATSSEFYIVAALVCAGFVFLPFLLVILGYLVTLAVLCRRELTWIVMSLVGLGAFGLVVYALSKTDITFNFTAAGEILKNENFTKTLMTLIIVSGTLIVLYPVALGLARHLKSTGHVSGYKAESERELSLKINENDMTVKLRSLELNREITLRRLELEEQQIRNERLRIEHGVSDPSRLLSHGAGSGAARPATPPPLPPPVPGSAPAAAPASAPAPPVPPPPPLVSAPPAPASPAPFVPPVTPPASDRIAHCVMCNAPSLFSAQNTSTTLCDDHSLDFQASWRRCIRCSVVSPVTEFAGASRLCRKCLGPHEGAVS